MNPKPAWWDAADEDAITRWRELHATHFLPEVEVDAEAWSQRPDVIAGEQRLGSFLDAHGLKWRCRRCLYWFTFDGLHGDCTGPELACGSTTALDTCEQFEPLP
ncbi:MAG: hypothetical protein K9N47_21190 [Prosthecobacter sp.]|uniref:hypothetical protein n=1 Tax=Prosthecobacter sp. TaxID=1965333 RepID=UPI0026224C33|nr:hypothetical protein [Prosthecobacter sp.]MCF7788652.1 hypothetical protein [Prosthecobacter sp.]